MKRRLDGFDEKTLEVVACLIGGHSIFGAFDEGEWDMILTTILWEADGFGGKLDKEVIGLSQDGIPIFVEMWEFARDSDNSRYSNWCVKTGVYISYMTAQMGGFDGGIVRAGALISQIVTQQEETPAAKFFLQNFPAEWFFQQIWPEHKHLVLNTKE